MAITDDILSDAGTTEGEIKSYLGGDNHENLEPVHDDLRDFDAVDYNKMVKAMAEVVKRLRPGNVTCVSYRLATTGGTATVPMLRMGSPATTTWYPFKSGTLVGITSRFTTAVTGGTVTIKPKIQGVYTDLTVVYSGSGTIGKERQIPSAAGTNDVISATIPDAVAVDVETSGATWAGATELIVDLFISIGEEEDI